MKFLNCRFEMQPKAASATSGVIAPPLEFPANRDFLRFNREFGDDMLRRRGSDGGMLSGICSFFVLYARGLYNFSGADFDDEAADRVDPRVVAGIEHGRRRDFLDDRRPGDLVAGEQRLAPPDRRVEPFAIAEPGRF